MCIFDIAKKGDKLIGLHGLSWKVQGPGNRGGIICINPNSDQAEEIFFRGGKVVDAQNWPIEEFAQGVPKLEKAKRE